MRGIFGGTFDPLHVGHIETARAVRRQFQLAQIMFVLSARPPHRQAPVANAQHRLQMLRLALAGDCCLVADDSELDCPGPSYTVWTLRRLRARFGRDPLALIMGLDAFVDLASWYHWEEILTLVHLLVLPRPGWDGREVGGPIPLTGAAEELERRQAGLVLLCETPRIDVSATQIRRDIAAGRSPAEQLPEAVWAYIREHGLYRA